MFKPLIIQFTGAQNSGKTTLVNAVKSHLTDTFNLKKDIPIIGEVSRDLLHRKVIGNCDVEASLQEQIIINGELLQRYFTALQSGSPIILAERTAVCCMAYYRLIISYFRGMSDMINYTDMFLQKFITSTRISNSLFDTLMFYTEPLLKFEEDGVRKSKSKDAVNTNVKSILKEYQIFHTTLMGYESVDERLKKVIYEVAKNPKIFRNLSTFAEMSLI